jgi:hypothetical protein
MNLHLVRPRPTSKLVRMHKHRHHEDARDARRQGLSLTAICKKFGMSKSTAYYIIRDIPTPPRTPKATRQVAKKSPLPWPRKCKWSGGYVMLTWADGTRKLEHRFVMEQITGSPIPEGIVVHHRNQVRSDNRPENLEMMDYVSHAVHHAEGRTVEMSERVCPWCSTVFYRRAARCRFDAKTGARTFCSRSCSGYFTAASLRQGGRTVKRIGSKVLTR